MAVDSSARPPQRRKRHYNRVSWPAVDATKPEAEFVPKRGARGRGRGYSSEVEYTDRELIVIKAVTRYQSAHHLAFMELRDYLACFEAMGWLNIAAITL